MKCDTSNALYVLVLWEQMSLKQTSETVSAKHRIVQIITQWVPGSRTSNSKCPMPRRAEAVSRYNQVMTPSRTKMPSTGHNRDGNVAVHQVLGRLVMEVVVHHRHEFKLNSLRHVEAMQVNVHKLHSGLLGFMELPANIHPTTNTAAFKPQIDSPNVVANYVINYVSYILMLCILPVWQWRSGLVVARCSWSTKLFYIGPG